MNIWFIYEFVHPKSINAIIVNFSKSPSSYTTILYGSAHKRPREYIFFYNVKHVFKQS